MGPGQREGGKRKISEIRSGEIGAGFFFLLSHIMFILGMKVFDESVVGFQEFFGFDGIDTRD
jgi:hypothetical protein